MICRSYDMNNEMQFVFPWKQVRHYAYDMLYQEYKVLHGPFSCKFEFLNFMDYYLICRSHDI
jgi:hypothetical protein